MKQLINQTPKIVFVGMSKNCFSTLSKNLSFLLKLKKLNFADIHIIIVDSDSDDGTKEFCKKLLKTGSLNQFIELDNLEIKHNSRIERLSICRNEALDYLKTLNDDLIYIPMDMDIELFIYTKIEVFKKLILSFYDNQNYEGLFPFSLPYYYDIFALRKMGWTKGNNMLKAEKIKKRILLFSGIINYIFIFRIQKPPTFFKDKYILVESAFGGIGMYKISKKLLTKINYKIEKSNIDFVSEHISFNKFFKNLYIHRDWNVPAPERYIFFKNSNLYQKMFYLLISTVKDLRKIFKK